MFSHSTSLLTPRGRGAVATILLRGDPGLLDAAPLLFRAAGGRPLASMELGRIAFGCWVGGNAGHIANDSSLPPEDVVVCRVSEVETEIHCHGGEAASRRILRDLAARGVVLEAISSGNAWSRFRMEAECLDVAARATTARTADFALAQAAGTLRSAITEIAEGVGQGDDWPAATMARLNGVLRWADFGRRLVEPRRVALVGRPNVGKSSLMNALVGFARSIVHDQPGTTRDVVTAETAYDGWPLCFADTAGLRESSELIETAGIARARREAARADLTILVVDVSDELTESTLVEERRLADEYPAALVVGQKADREDRRGDGAPRPEWRVSARTGVGVEPLLREIVSRLFPAVPPPDAAVPPGELSIGALHAAVEAARAADDPRCREILDGMLSAPCEVG